MIKAVTVITLFVLGIVALVAGVCAILALVLMAGWGLFSPAIDLPALSFAQAFGLAIFIAVVGVLLGLSDRVESVRK